MKAFTRINNVFIKSEGVLMAILTVVCTGSIFIQVICRYLLFVPVPWTEELAKYAFVWLCWIGAAAAMAKHKHIEMDLIDSLVAKAKNPDKIMGVLNFCATLIAVLFMCVFTIIYGQFYMKIVEGNQYSSAMKLHYMYPMGSIMVGSALMIFHGIYNLIANKGMGAQEQAHAPAEDTTSMERSS